MCVCVCLCVCVFARARVWLVAGRPGRRGAAWTAGEPPPLPPPPSLSVCLSVRPSVSLLPGCRGATWSAGVQPVPRAKPVAAALTVQGVLGITWDTNHPPTHPRTHAPTHPRTHTRVRARTRVCTGTSGGGAQRGIERQGGGREKRRVKKGREEGGRFSPPYPLPKS